MGTFASRGGLFLNAPLKRNSDETSYIQQDFAQQQLDMPVHKAGCNTADSFDRDDFGENSNTNTIGSAIKKID